jgi:hypothetical protein
LPQNGGAGCPRGRDFRKDLKRIGKLIVLFAFDRDRYSNGPFRPKYSRVSFDFMSLPVEARPSAFVTRLLEIHRQPKPLVD